jgi:hypothetical protein
LPSGWIDYDADSDGQTIEVDIPSLLAGGSGTITVDYLAAPNLPDVPQFGTIEGDEFRFVFVNGYSIEGSTDPASADPLVGHVIYVYNPDGSSWGTIPYEGTKNDMWFDPPEIVLPYPDGELVDDPAFLMHLSCSDRFIDGWGETDGPAEGIDVNWQIASYVINRFNLGQGDLAYKTCGDTPVKFTVDNTATVDWLDSEGEHSASDTATVEIVDPSLVFPEEDAVEFKNRDVYFKFVSLNPEDMVITQIEVTWPVDQNGDLTNLMLGKSTIWSGSLPGATAIVCDANPCASGDEPDAVFTGDERDRTLEALEKEKLRFTFENKPVADPALYPYTFVVTFADGTDVSISTPTTP